ncbi:hypothetical protein [Lactococcus garvieae]
MKQLYDETYKSEEQSSRNIWYSNIQLSKVSEYGSLINLSEEVITSLTGVIQNDLKVPEPNTETNWYFYDSVTNKDAIEDEVRSSVMVKKSFGDFLVHVNCSDHNFAININEIQKQKEQLEGQLNKL